ncbi:molybdopterin biosynthesis protein (chloroplast) [Galdieria partita]|uniref:Molybdopterin biosynthesis protein n=1 Tax=Galdieria partita TaxID=83374 RepID=A0A9C7BR63_9RHOD|nr:molybdopterin biosynthesis protein [Galdieria partita]
MLNPDLNSLELTTTEYERYNKHLILPQVQIEGQKRLKIAKVLCIGAGGLASSILTYLVSSGIGIIGIIDYDIIELSNLPRQTIYNTKDIGSPKVNCAKQNLSIINSDCQIHIYNEKLNIGNAVKIIKNYDLIIDCTDNFEIRLLINDICYLLSKTLIFGAVIGFQGQVAIFNYQSSSNYRDLYSIQTLNSMSQLGLCNSGGVISILPSLTGLLQISEALKIIIGYRSSLVEYIININLLDSKFKESRLRTGNYIKYNLKSKLKYCLYNSFELYFKYLFLDIHQIILNKNFTSKETNINIIKINAYKYKTQKKENFFFIPICQLKNFLLEIKKMNISYVNLIFPSNKGIYYYKAYLIIRQITNIYPYFYKDIDHKRERDSNPR